MARKTGCLRTGETTIARSAASILVADAAAGTDAATPPAQALDCSGFDTIFVGLEVTVPGTSTSTVEPYFYDPDAPDGSRWSKALLGAAPGVTLGALAAEVTPALPGTGASYAELRVNGHSKVFLRLATVANAVGTTAWKILVRPGKIRGDRSINRKAP